MNLFRASFQRFQEKKLWLFLSVVENVVFLPLDGGFFSNAQLFNIFQT